MKIIENFFENDSLFKIKTYLEELQNDPTFIHKDMWPERLTMSEGNVGIYYFDKNIDNEVYELIYQKMSSFFSIKPISITFHYWQPSSFIPWHDDGNKSAAATIYLNEYWDADYGGLFLYDELNGEGIRGIVPHFNKCIFQPGGLWHCTTQTHFKAPVRKSLQVFF